MGISFIHGFTPVVWITLNTHLEDEIVQRYEVLGLEELSFIVLNEIDERLSFIPFHSIHHTTTNSPLNNRRRAIAANRFSPGYHP